MWWSSLLLAGFLGGCWGVFALAAAPPVLVADDDGSPSPSGTWRRSTAPMTSSSSSSGYVDDYYYGKTMIFGFEPPPREESPGYRSGTGVRAQGNRVQLRRVGGGGSRLRHRRQMEAIGRNFPARAVRRDAVVNRVAAVQRRVSREQLPEPAASSDSDSDEADYYDEEEDYEADDSPVGPAATDRRHYVKETSPSVAIGPIDEEDEDEEDPRRPRIGRSLGQQLQLQQQQSKQRQLPRELQRVQQRGRNNRTRSDSAREQRRRCRNRNCRGRNWCPDMDVGNRAYLAPTVFEGKARSMSSVRKPGSNYAVTFEVKQVYKSQPGFLPLQKNDSVRLHFRDKTVPGKSTLCGHNNDAGAGGNKEVRGGQQQQLQQQKEQRDNLSAGVVRANIKRGKVYLVFVNRVGPRNFTILGEPVIRSKKNEQAVQAVIRPDYVREVTLSELRDSVARYRDRVKLVCRTRGSPPPRVHWLKDGVPLQPRRGLRIQHKRRRSKVVISSARPEDSGRYECVAESTSGHRASLAAQLLVAHDTRIPETTTAAWLRQEQPCPIAGDFCMNGGTCLFFETVGEPACRCAEGFTGLRCETKDVISTGSVYNRHRAPFSCKLGLSTSYYC